MVIDENKYNDLFIKKFKVYSDELYSEFNKVIEEFGNTEEIKLAFYSRTFEIIITQFKKDLPKDENYQYIIISLYKYYIDALEEDKIDNTKFKKDLEEFKTYELKKFKKEKVSNTIDLKPIYKNYNLNTNYGRRKAREQANSNYENGTPEYRREIDSIRTVVWVVIFIIAIIIFLIKTSLKE